MDNGNQTPQQVASCQEKNLSKFFMATLGAKHYELGMNLLMYLGLQLQKKKTFSGINLSTLNITLIILGIFKEKNYMIKRWKTTGVLGLFSL